MTVPTTDDMVTRLIFHESSETLLIDLSSIHVSTREQVDIIFNAIRNCLHEYDKKLDVIVTYDGFSVDDEVISYYGENLAFFQDNIYKSVTRFTTRTIEENQIKKLRKYMDEQNQEFELNLDTKFIDDRYMLQQNTILGEGAFGKVSLAIDKRDKKKVAIKRISRRKMAQVNATEYVKREIEIMKKLKHKNIIALVDFIETDHSYYIVMEYCDGGSLDIEYNQYSEQEAWKIFVQLAEAVRYIHECGVIHRDLQLSNICMHNGVVKLLDFGLSDVFENSVGITCEHDSKRGVLGNASHCAPEVLTEQGGYNKSTDIWSLGVCLYRLLFGCFPFNPVHNVFVMKYTVGLEEEDLSDEVRDLLRHMLEKSPNQRYTIEQVLEHAWMKKFKD
jgi:tRNA A-37 threonylcarbamoyl transferase component Bud32